jgi:shikimate kinase
VSKVKAVILGAPAVGKTTLIKYLRPKIKLSIIDQDDEVTRKGGGDWPADLDRVNALRAEISAEIFSKDSVVFFASYVQEEDLRLARELGFRIILLQLGRLQLEERNSKRMREEGYDDMRIWYDQTFEYQERILRDKLVDLVIDASQPTEKISEEVVKCLDPLTYPTLQ